MEYDYEPLRDPKNNFAIARKELENEILLKSLKLNENLESITSTQIFRDWFEVPLFDLEKKLIREREALVKNNTYFFGCSFEVYRLNYDARLQSYLKKYYDATEQDFINYELRKKFSTFFELEVNRYDLDQKFEYSIICEHVLGEQIMFSLKARNKFLTDKLNNNVTPGEPENIYLGQPTNETANKLFDYLIEHYRPNEKTSVKYVNILQYLKKDANKDLYIFNVRQKDFKQMIKSKIGIEILKFQISEKYKEVEKPILNSLETSFRN